jgi:hypothetical protein
MTAGAAPVTTVLTITEASEPNALVSKSSLLDSGNSYTTTTAPLDQLGYRFVYWRINGVRQADAAGRSVNPVTFTPVANTTVTAIYVPLAQDSDADGIPDWYEYEYFGDLTKTLLSDSDADQLSLALELVFGTHPSVVNEYVEGGFSRRSSAAFLAKIDPEYYEVTIRSDPENIVTRTTSMKKGEVSVTLPTPSDPSLGYRFIGWYRGDVRADTPFTLHPAVMTVSGATAFRTGSSGCFSRVFRLI